MLIAAATHHDPCEDDEAPREEQVQRAVQFDDRLLSAVQFLTDPTTQNTSLEDRKK
jgi:hypothetical protein